jgi:hypothetical protein|tara:strand:- start:242 stop:439 length:198 start_codon:yes stop_codon:yes gene_type:complete
MIDEDRTYENEVRFNNDRLVGRKNSKDSKRNIPLGLESTNTSEISKEEKVNGLCSDDGHVCVCSR